MALARSKKHTLSGYLLITPSALTLLLVVLLPILYVVYLSFSGFYYGQRTGFVGLKNYINILTDPNFYSALKATASFTVGSVAGQLLLALVFALTINEAGKGEAAVRMIAILPYMVSMVAGGVTFRWMLNTEFGLINAILISSGSRSISWASRAWPWPRSSALTSGPPLPSPP